VSAFIDARREDFGVELICRTIGTSPSAYYQRAGGRRSARAVEDDRLLGVIRRVHSENYEAYGSRRTWKALLREGETARRGRVERLMARNAIVGAKRRGKPWRTTIAGPVPGSTPDLLKRDFTARRPNERWCADFTYLRCWTGVVFLSFVIDVYSRMIVGWQLAGHMRESLVEDALQMAVATRRIDSRQLLIHHSDHGSQGGFNWSSQHLDRGGCDGQAGGMDEGVDGSVGDEVAGQAVASARCRASVLAADRRRLEQRRRGAVGRGVAGGWQPMVQGAWRDGDVHARPGLVPVPVL
jgi:putative transposase